MKRNSVVVPAQLINRISTIALVIFSIGALLVVLSGYIQPPQRNDAREYIFQLSIVALVPMLLLFAITADWRQPVRSARPLALPAAAAALAFAGLYILEHSR